MPLLIGIPDPPHPRSISILYPGESLPPGLSGAHLNRAVKHKVVRLINTTLMKASNARAAYIQETISAELSRTFRLTHFHEKRLQNTTTIRDARLVCKCAGHAYSRSRGKEYHSAGEGGESHNGHSGGM